MYTWWFATSSKTKNSGTAVFLSAFRNFQKDRLCRTCPSKCLSEMNQKNCIHRSYSQETRVLDSLALQYSCRKAPVMASFLGQLQTDGLTVFPNGLDDAFLWKLRRFTEHHFYRTMLRDCFWFPVTISMYHLLYQW